MDFSSASRRNSDGADSVFSDALRPSLLPALCAAASSLLAYGRFFRDTNSLIAAAACGAVFLLALPFYLKRGNPVLRFFVCAAVCCAAAYAVHARADGLLRHAELPPAEAWTADVTEVTPGRYTDRLVLSMRSADGTGPEALANAWGSKDISFRSGDRIALSARPAEAKPDLVRQGIHYSVSLREANWTFISRGEPSPREVFRSRLVKLNTALYGERNGGVISALMLGDSFFADKSTTYDFTRAGVLHILAASGTHVAIVAAIPMLLFALIRLPKKGAYLATSFVLAAYFCVTCMPVSLLRACVMFWIIAAVRLFGRTQDSLNALYLSAAVILVLYPYDLFSLGFQLSYGATFGVILFLDRFRAALPKLPLKTSDSIAMTLAAQIAVLPALCATIGELNLTGLLSNIVLVPLTGFIFIGAIACDCLAVVCHSAAAFAAQGLTLAMDANLHLAHQFARMPGHFITADFPLWLLLPYAALCVPLVLSRQRRLIAGACIVTAVIASAVPLAISGRQKPAALSPVGQDGGRALYREGEKSLVYGGVRTPEERDAVRRELRAHGYTETSVYLSDFSSESLRETSMLVRSLPVREVVLAEGLPADGRLLPLLEAFEADGITPVFERAGKNSCHSSSGVYLMKTRCEAALEASRRRNGGQAQPAALYM